MASITGEVQEQRVAKLAASFPDAPAAELRRFARARPGSASEARELYEQHLAWRRGNGAPERLLAASRVVPQKFVRLGGRARDGTQIIFLQGARYDHHVTPEEYVLACAEIIEAAVSREDERRVTLLIDVRPGEDWPNPNAPTMLPFIQQAVLQLPKQYPERVQRVVVYPMPWLMKYIWGIVSPFADPGTREKVILLSGSDSKNAPCPDEVGEFVSRTELPIDAQPLHGNLAD